MRTGSIAVNWFPSAWVEEHRQRVSFGLQVFPIDTPEDPARALDRRR
jgi:hypothetical protein